MSKTSNSSADSELLEIVNRYRNAIKIEENSYDETLNKESEEFEKMWYNAFPEQLNEAPYLAQQQKKLKNSVYKKTKS